MASQRLLAVVGVTLLLVLGGCLSGSGVGQAPSPTPTPSSTATSETPAPASSTATPTPGGHERAMNHPDPDKAVLVKNEWNQSVAMHVQVIRAATNTTVHDETYQLTPGMERPVYNTTAANPDGIEAFTVVVTARNTTERVTIKTNNCYGAAYAEVLDDGTLYLYYSIC